MQLKRKRLITGERYYLKKKLDISAEEERSRRLYADYI
jgi:hypothetical protein